jgi:hypothetical protein
MSAPFAINPETGTIRFPELSLELRSGMPESEFIAATSKLNRDNLGFNVGWQRYNIRQEISDDRILGMFLIFLHEKLWRISFVYAHKDESWDNWTEEGEQARLAEYKQELTAQLGGKDNFPWGRAWVFLDSKSGGTDIWVEFSGGA